MGGTSEGEAQFLIFLKQKNLGLVRGLNPGHLCSKRVLYPLHHAPRASFGLHLIPTTSCQIAPFLLPCVKLVKYMEGTEAIECSIDIFSKMDNV